MDPSRAQQGLGDTERALEGFTDPRGTAGPGGTGRAHKPLQGTAAAGEEGTGSWPGCARTQGAGAHRRGVPPVPISASRRGGGGFLRWSSMCRVISSREAAEKGHCVQL